jgi:hypothetical protein
MSTWGHWLRRFSGFDERDVLPAPQRHWQMLLLCTFAAVGAFCLRLGAGDRVLLRLPWDIPVPPLCPLHEYLGIPCPGCGLTRSFILLAEGKFVKAFEMNRVGFVLGVMVPVQFPYRIVAILRPQRATLPRRWGNRIAAVVVAMLLLNWLLALTVWPQADEKHSPTNPIALHVREMQP